MAHQSRSRKVTASAPANGKMNPQPWGVAKPSTAWIKGLPRFVA